MAFSLESVTHKSLVRRMAAWLRGNQNCSVVVAELATRAHETPDVLGFKETISILVECKVSRSDLKADQKKFFRAYPEQGMGDYRYIATPKGLITEADVPPLWGWLELDENDRVRRRKDPENQQACKRAETLLLVSALRRLELSTAVFIRPEPDPEESLETNPEAADPSSEQPEPQR